MVSSDEMNMTQKVLAAMTMSDGALKAKSFTSKEIMLHFFLLDALRGGGEHTTRTLTDRLAGEYLCCFDRPPTFDESTVRNKLKEYEMLGLFTSSKHYSRSGMVKSALRKG